VRLSAKLEFGFVQSLSSGRRRQDPVARPGMTPSEAPRAMRTDLVRFRTATLSIALRDGVPARLRAYACGQG
jgi:hypothetical protein